MNSECHYIWTTNHNVVTSVTLPRAMKKKLFLWSCLLISKVNSQMGLNYHCRWILVKDVKIVFNVRSTSLHCTQEQTHIHTSTVGDTDPGRHYIWTKNHSVVTWVPLHRAMEKKIPAVKLISRLIVIWAQIINVDGYSWRMWKMLLMSVW